MFEKGEKVVCVNGEFSRIHRELYRALPVKGVIYTVRDTELGRSKPFNAPKKGWGCVAMKTLLVELVNPVDPTTVNGQPSELGFDSSRFAPVQNIKTSISNSKKEPVLV